MPAGAVPRPCVRRSGPIDDQRIGGHRLAQRNQSCVEFALQHERKAARVGGGHERHRAACVIDDAAHGRERRRCARPSSLDQIAFDTCERLECAFVLLWRRLSRLEGQESIRVLGIGRVEEPGSAECVRGFGGSPVNLMNKALVPVKRGATRIDPIIALAD